MKVKKPSPFGFFINSRHNKALHCCISILGLVMLFGVASGQTPTAEFDGTPISGTAPLTVTFTDQSTGNPTGWAWYFGDENYTVPWTQMTSSAGWSARASHSSVAMPDGSIVLMGGSYGTLKNDVWRSTDNLSLIHI